MNYDHIMKAKKTYICYVVLLTFIPIFGRKHCVIRTESNKRKRVCCADFEEKGNGCIACLKGYTSYMGQNCKPCSKYTYGERCRYECSCLDFEICNNVEGCVMYSSTTGNPLYETSDAYIPHLRGNRCDVRTVSGELKKVCCADYEEKGNYCIACSKGYTSYMGQSCKPCSKNTYGERCRYECVCIGFEKCNHVEGCIPSSQTPGTSLFATSYDRTYIWTRRSVTDSENELSSSEIIAYCTLPLMILALGLSLCFIFYKYKIVGKIKKVTITHSENPSLPKNRQDIETEGRLYDTIGDSNMLQYVQQMLKSTSSVRDDSKIAEDHDYPCQLMSTVQTNKQENKHGFRFFISRENTSSSDESHHETMQQFLNQSVGELSTPQYKDSVTVATVHMIDSSLSDIRSSKISPT